MRSFVTLLVLFAAAASAQTPGSCETGLATGTLDASDVQAAFPTTGMLFYTPDTQYAYDAPQMTGISPIFAASVWIGGTVGGEFRVAGATYGQGGANDDRFEFWPGPLDSGATLPNAADCSAFDRVWVVSRRDVDAYEGGASPTDDLADWPVGLGAPAVDASGAPLSATPRDRTLDLDAGERPVIYGTQSAFWIMNDVGGRHLTTGSAPLGIEVAVTAFVTESETLALHQSTILRYAITNRNSADIEDLRLALFADTDLGFAGDDFVGSDVARSMGYTYNADSYDDVGYRSHPPALGIDILGGDANRDPEMTAFVYYFGADANRNDPSTATEYAAALDGVWSDGTPITANGNGYNQGGEVTTFAFSGDPVTQSFWSEENTGQGRSPTDGDRRMVVATELGRLASGETAVLDAGILYALGTDRLNSVTALRAASDEIQQRYDAGTLVAPATLPTGALAAAPALVAPAQDAAAADTVALAWQAVTGATDYLYQTSESPSFEDNSTVRTRTQNTVTTTGSYVRTSLRDFERSDLPIYWRVRARRGAVLGPWSESRSFRYTAETPVPDEFVVEIVGPGGADPCGPDAGSALGCPPPGSPFAPTAPGNLVYFSYNGSGAYALSFAGSEGTRGHIGTFAPNDYEVRVVPENEGSYGFYSFTSDRLIRVPFEIWDIGIVTPGEPNDPADDVQMVPVLFADAGEEAVHECTFGFNGSPSIYFPNNRPTTQRIYAYYPVGDDYAAFETLAASLVAADANACPSGAVTAPVNSRIDFDRGRPIQRDVFVQAGSTTSMADLQGTVIRYYTREGSTPSEPEPRPVAGLTLDAPMPNPASGRASVVVGLDRPGRVTVSMLDLLGRRVAVLADGPREAGRHRIEATISGLAAGTYVVVAEASGQRTSRLLTIVR